MKRSSFSILIALFIFTNSFSQTLSETDKLASLGQVWGFLKYFHPNVAKHKFDWDKELINIVPKVRAAANKQELSNLYLEWINSLGAYQQGKDLLKDKPDSLKKNIDEKWMLDPTLFTAELTHKLIELKTAKRPRKNYYLHAGMFAGFNEQIYPQMHYPNEEHRLLSLYIYWNAINYFFPYKYLMGRDWNDVLKEMIPVFRNAMNIRQYESAIIEIAAKINDSHASVGTNYTKGYFGRYYPPFRTKMIDNKMIVTLLTCDSICKLGDIRVGDIILKIDDQTVEDKIRDKKKYISGSNESCIMRGYCDALFNSDSVMCKITLERDGKVCSKEIKRVLMSARKKGYPSYTYKEIGNDISYIHLGNLERKETKEICKKAKEKKAIIFDMRAYPKWTIYKITHFLKEKRSPFVRFTQCDYSYPGLLSPSDNYSGMYTSRNKNPYKGQVIILCNEYTQSQAEFMMMAMQSAGTHVKIVGSQTAGADGNVTFIGLPGGIRCNFTGVGVYYPDGRETQRIGIVPDIKVEPTIEGIRAGKDEVLERALQFIETGK